MIIINENKYDIAMVAVLNYIAIGIYVASYKAS